MNIVLSDDDSIFLDYLYRTIQTYPFGTEYISITMLSPVQLDSQLKQRAFPFDIFITDIDMGNLNGIDIAKIVNEINPACIIIFISNHINFATRVYDTKHIYFVLKAEVEERLPKALHKAIQILDDHKSTLLTIRFQNVEYIIPHNDIVYIEALGRYLFIHNGSDSIKYIGTLKLIATQLSEKFVRCHNSYIVNMRHIRSISRTNCTMRSGISIPVSQGYSKKFQDAYIKYVSDKII